MQLKLSRKLKQTMNILFEWKQYDWDKKNLCLVFLKYNFWFCPCLDVASTAADDDTADHIRSTTDQLGSPKLLNFCDCRWRHRWISM